MKLIWDVLDTLTHRSRDQNRDFPDGPVVMTLPSNAGELELLAGQGIKSRASEQLSWQATPTEPTQLEKPALRNKDPAQPND